MGLKEQIAGMSSRKDISPSGNLGMGVFYASFRFFGSEHMEEDTVIPGINGERCRVTSNVAQYVLA